MRYVWAECARGDGSTTYPINKGYVGDYEVEIADLSTSCPRFFYLWTNYSLTARSNISAVSLDIRSVLNVYVCRVVLTSL